MMRLTHTDFPTHNHHTHTTEQINLTLALTRIKSLSESVHLNLQFITASRSEYRMAWRSSGTTNDELVDNLKRKSFFSFCREWFVLSCRKRVMRAGSWRIGKYATSRNGWFFNTYTHSSHCDVSSHYGSDKETSFVKIWRIWFHCGGATNVHEWASTLQFIWWKQQLASNL